MTILITGGCGYIGSHVVRQLSELKEKVLVLDNLVTGFKQALIYNEKLIQIDLADTLNLEKVFIENSIDSVLHFAASTIVPESIENPCKYYQNNTQNTFNLINLCLKYKVKNFVFSSTAAVYNVSSSGVACEETTPTNPITPYGKSKLFSEIMLKDIASASDLKYVILRYFNVAGADPILRTGQRARNASHLITVCCKAGTNQIKQVEVFGTDYETPDGSCIRDYIHVEDLAMAHIKALDYLYKGGQSEIINLGYGKGHSVKEVIKVVRQISDNNFAIKERPRREGDLPVVIAKINKATKLLNWQPKFANLEKIVEHSYNWELAMLESTNALK